MRLKVTASEWTDPRWTSPEHHLFDVLESARKSTSNPARIKLIDRWIKELKAKKVKSRDLIRYLESQKEYCYRDKPYCNLIQSLIGY